MDSALVKLRRKRKETRRDGMVITPTGTNERDGERKEPSTIEYNPSEGGRAKKRLLATEAQLLLL